MSTKTSRTAITVRTTVNANIDKVWKYYAEPEHITQWAHASDDWHAPYAENDLRKDGRFKTTMAAKDGSVSFDFTGVYTDVQPHKRIAYTMDDGRKVDVLFESDGNTTTVTQTFEAEDQNPIDMQRDGWQAILDNFRKHVEANGK
ncbi:MAG: SRPBCC family protein [Cyclobacteriaceae bacterium]|nr:SRPBCC family protein [Cyclobacteriaceae bacterium]